jgi:hypothetical protein
VRCVLLSGTLDPLARWLANPEPAGHASNSSQYPMIRPLIALSIFALLGASVIALPGYAPQVEAGEAVALAKGTRLDVRPTAFDCSQ